MNNKIAKKLSLVGNIYLGFSIFIGFILSIQEKVVLSKYSGRVIKEWSVTSLINGIIMILTGIIISLLFKGIAELIENNYLNLECQKEIINLLKNNQEKK